MQIFLSEQGITGCLMVFFDLSMQTGIAKIRLCQEVIIIRIGKLWTIHEYSRLVLVDQVVSLYNAGFCKVGVYLTLILASQGTYSAGIDFRHQNYNSDF